jgi:hypothetical protein
MRPAIPRDCPRCKRAGVAGEATEVGSFYECPDCGCEWVEGVPLDFQND